MIESRIKPQRSFADPFYKVEYKGAYLLSLILGRDSLQAAVLDLKDNTYLTTEEYIFEGIQNDLQLKGEFENIYKSSPILKAEFEKITVGISNEYNSLVPIAFFEPENKKGIFEFTQGKKEDYIILEDQLVNIKAKNLFAVPESILNFIQKIYPSAQIRHFSTSLIDGMALKFKQNPEENVVIHTQYSHFEILYFKDGILQYYNSFNYTTAEDFIYYILFAFEQLKLNPDLIKVELLGELDSESATYGMLYKYVRHVSFGGRPNILNYSNILDALPENHFFTLYQQFLCA